MAVRDQDGFNWGYDPWHYTVPEGSYATDPDGAARIREFREMVQGLSKAGTARGDGRRLQPHQRRPARTSKSVLDRVVPGYYHRLNARRRRRDELLLPEHRQRAPDDGEADGRLRAHLGAASTRWTASASTSWATT